MAKKLFGKMQKITVMKVPKCQSKALLRKTPIYNGFKIIYFPRNAFSE